MLRDVITKLGEYPIQKFREVADFEESFPREIPFGYEPFYEWKGDAVLIGIRRKAVVTAAPMPAVASTAPNDGVIGSNETDAPLESLKYNDLLTLAGVKGVPVKGRPKALDIIAAIRAKDAESASATPAPAADTQAAQ